MHTLFLSIFFIIFKKSQKIKDPNFKHGRTMQQRRASLQRSEETEMGEMGVGDPGAGDENEDMVGELRHAGDGGGSLRRGGFPLQGAARAAQLPGAGGGFSSAGQFSARGRQTGGS
ncbi:unnamed protein product [Cuscuta europaea]|uniref:Uncharacterized protein n=1 Tax=Cuscuta europaea TaxID=41803 RepID=A0A9P0ZQM0_CUSEU|nr:unnamed protein product [Cuscuta europaea]